MRVIKKSVISAISLIAFLFFGPVEMVYHYWCKLVLHDEVAGEGCGIKEVYANVLSTVEEALGTFLRGAEQITEERHVLTEGQRQHVEAQAKVKLDPVLDREFRFYVGKKDGQVMAYAVQDTVAGKWGPIRYMLSLDPTGRVLDAMVLEYEEKRGRPVAKRRFLKQFIGKTRGDEIKLMKDIRGVSGASISSRGMADGIKKMVHIFHELYVTK